MGSRRGLQAVGLAGGPSGRRTCSRKLFPLQAGRAGLTRDGFIIGPTRSAELPDLLISIPAARLQTAAPAPAAQRSASAAQAQVWRSAQLSRAGPQPRPTGKQ